MVWQGRGSVGYCLAPCQVECEKIFPRMDKVASIPVFFSLVQQSICKELALGGPQQRHLENFCWSYRRSWFRDILDIYMRFRGIVSGWPGSWRTHASCMPGLLQGIRERRNAWKMGRQQGQWFETTLLGIQATLSFPG